MPALSLVVGALFIMAFALWLNIFEESGKILHICIVYIKIYIIR